jgi:deoxycytidine triphosphate deaminase
MATLLKDADIKQLLGNVIINGDVSCIRPNSYIIRLGSVGEFLTAKKAFTLGTEKKGIRVRPWHSVALTAFETINFGREAVSILYPNHDLHGILSPTTNLSREGVVAPTTQIDAGYYGTLNWTINNISNEERRYLFKEQMLRLTIFKLERGETPERLYSGEYQGLTGYVPSTRKGPPIGIKETEWEDSGSNEEDERAFPTVLNSYLRKRVDFKTQNAENPERWAIRLNSALIFLIGLAFSFTSNQTIIESAIKNGKWIGAGMAFLGLIGFLLTLNRKR